MTVAVVIGIGVSLSGLALSYAPGWPPGATIVEIAVLVYLAAACFANRRKGNQQVRGIFAGL
jgi:ABC-type Mn2+/Zn2+ transport system permease subunit